MEIHLAQVSEDGAIILPDEIRAAFAHVRAFWVTQQDNFIVLVPVKPEEEALTAKQALEALQEGFRRAGKTGRPLDEIIAELRAIRKEIWEKEYHPKYAKALEEYYAAHPDRRPR